MCEVDMSEVDGRAPVVAANGFYLRAAQVRIGEVGRSELDGSLAGLTFDGELRAAQVGMGEVGSSQVDACAGVRTFGSKRRPTQVGMGETGFPQLEHPLPLECGAFEVAVRQVRPAQLELLVRCAERGAGARDRPALVA